MIRCTLLVAVLSAAVSAAPQTPPPTPAPAPTAVEAASPPLATFRNLNQTFQIDLPKDWRQIAPNEAVRIGENPKAPRQLTLSAPRAFYAVGPVERWLAGDFDTPWLYVVESDEEWYLADDYADLLRAAWRKEGDASGVQHALEDVQKVAAGTQRVQVVMARRKCQPPAPALATTSLDVHAPAGGRQVTLSFQCPPERFARWEPQFRAWLETLTFARVDVEPPTMGERLWTPLLTGGAVALVLLLLYKHTRARR